MGSWSHKEISRRTPVVESALWNFIRSAMSGKIKEAENDKPSISKWKSTYKARDRCIFVVRKKVF